MKTLSIKGLRLAGIHSGVKRGAAGDLMLVLPPKGANVGGIFTRSSTASAAVLRCRRLLAANGGRVGALLVNSGNANVFTGEHGERAVEEMARAAAEIADCPADEVFIASTGVIGERLPYEKIIAALPALAANLGEGNWQAAAKAIMTTDTEPKSAFAQLAIGSETIKIGGIAKGAGMIAPNMATMLAFIFTDLALENGLLQSMLTEAAATTFNAITVDGDTSTSDSCFLLSTNQIRARGDLSGFKAALHRVCAALARQIVGDAEGAKKLITVRVSGGENTEAARRIAFAIAESPLVKIALGAGDPNWGRIVMAIGKTGIAVKRDELTISLNRIRVAENGGAAENFNGAECRRSLERAEILLEVGLGDGNGEFTVLTSDLNDEYVRINANYRS